MTSSLTTTAERTAALSSPRPLAYPQRMHTAADDSALMLRYQAGDVTAFETLYRRHKDPIYRYLLRLCRHQDTAEDLYQDVWGKIIKARASYRPTAKFTTFLYRVAHNCFIDHVRRNKRHEADVELLPETISHPGEAPDVSTELSMARERLRTALLDLPEEQRDAYLLREEAGLSIDEIAAVTGCNRETAKSRLRYAINKLRKAIDESQDGA